MSKNKVPTMLILACLALMLLAGIANGVMDTLQFHYGKSIFPQAEGETFLGGSRTFWDPDMSWRNKYEGGDPASGPAFWMSTTALVFLTDGWHLFQFLMLSAFQLAIILPFLHFLRLRWWYAIAAFVPAKVVFGAGFTLMYGWMLLERRKKADQTSLKQ